MKFIIETKLKWKTTKVIILDKDDNEVLSKDIEFVDNLYSLNIKNENAFKMYFTNGKVCSEYIALSDNLSKISLYQNKKTHLITANLFVDKCSDYGKVETYVLEDKINLYYREDTSKIINVLVPPKYNKNKTYKLLIVFDSQNMFDVNKVGKYTKNNDPYGGWQVETSLKQISKRYKKDYIVVGIENADMYRMSELTPSLRRPKIRKEFYQEVIEDTFGVMHLNDLDAFIHETLLPFIKDKYNVESKYSILGSSCGGLASLYVGLRNISLCETVYCFTPASALFEDKTIIKMFKSFKFKKHYNELPYFFFFQGGSGQLEMLLKLGNKDLVSNLIKTGYDESKIYTYLEDSADHNEDAWRFAFNFGVEKAHKFHE